MNARSSAEESARLYFRAIMQKNSKSFALASKLLPEPTRRAAAVVYAWCRRADDAIDLSSPETQRAELARLEAELEEVYGDAKPSDPTLAAFRTVVNRFAIPREYPAELLLGMRMDVENIRYDSLEQLLSYCYRVAGTVGLMMCHVMGLRDGTALRNAAHLGMAMQLTNICRDVQEDWGLGRLYVPREILVDHGSDFWRAGPQGRLPDSAKEPLTHAVRRLLDEAERYYASADRGFFALRWRSALAARSARLIYAAIGQKLRRRHCDVFGGRAATSRAVKLGLVARAVLSTLLELPRRIGLPFRPTRIRSIVRFPRDVLPV